MERQVPTSKNNNASFQQTEILSLLSILFQFALFFFLRSGKAPAPTSTNLIIRVSLNKPWRRVRLVDALLRFCFLELHWLDTTCKRRYHGCGVHVCHNTTVNTPRTKPPEQQRSRRGPPPLPQTGSGVPLLCSSRACLAPNGYWGLFRFVVFFFL